MDNERNPRALVLRPQRGLAAPYREDAVEQCMSTLTPDKQAPLRLYLERKIELLDALEKNSYFEELLTGAGLNSYDVSDLEKVLARLPAKKDSEEGYFSREVIYSKLQKFAPIMGQVYIHSKGKMSYRLPLYDFLLSSLPNVQIDLTSTSLETSTKWSKWNPDYCSHIPRFRLSFNNPGGYVLLNEMKLCGDYTLRGWMDFDDASEKLIQYYTQEAKGRGAFAKRLHQGLIYFFNLPNIILEKFEIEQRFEV